MSLIKACSKCGSEDLVKKGSDTNVKHAITLYGEQTGPSQAAGGSANGLTVYLEGLIPFPDTDFLFRRYLPKMSLLPLGNPLQKFGITSPHSLHPLPPSQGGRGSG